MADAFFVQKNGNPLLKPILHIVWLGYLLLTACSESPTDFPKDVHSASEHALARAEHLVWRARVNFEQRRLEATASWLIQKSTNAKYIVFDTYDLNILKVTLDNGEAAVWTLSDSTAYLGRALRIAIAPETEWVHIEYRSNPGAKGLQWLEAHQTHTKLHPFLFSQGQAILTRTWLPCQDSPGLRFSFEAEVLVPKGLMAVMSAENPRVLAKNGRYRFKNSKPIPAYLFSIAVGNFDYKAYDQRSGIYAEAGTLGDAWQEFANLPAMMLAAEKLFGPYPWSRFDVLVLPPSFPFGGMENPMIMFATPSIIAGDRSLTNLIAHELSHSWSGNLVTHASWNDFWINEGFTTYIERRIIEEIEGTSYAEMLTALGDLTLEQTLKQLGPDNALSKLKLDLEGQNPDLALSNIPFYKGVALLLHIEKEVGRSRMDAYVKKTISNHAYRSMDSEMFLAYLEKHLLTAAQMERLEIEQWIFDAGIPKSYQKRHSIRFANVETAVLLWEQGEVAENLPTAAWSVYEWLYFLKTIGHKRITPSRMAELDATFNFGASRNAELLTEWLQCVIKNKYTPGYDRIPLFLAETGRRKLLVPVYEALFNNASLRNQGIQWFEVYKSQYHPLAIQSIEALK